MPRISHNRSMLAVHFTAEERKQLKFDRAAFTLHRKSEKEFLRLHPLPPGKGKGGTSITGDGESYRLQLSAPEIKSLPLFGPEEAQMIVLSSGTVILSRPTMTKPLVKRTTQLNGNGHAKVPDPAEEIPNLTAAFAVINRAMKQIPDLEIELDQTNRVIRGRRIVEY